MVKHHDPVWIVQWITHLSYNRRGKSIFMPHLRAKSPNFLSDVYQTWLVILYMWFWCPSDHWKWRYSSLSQLDRRMVLLVLPRWLPSGTTCLIGLYGSPAPQGSSHWSLKLRVFTVLHFFSFMTKLWLSRVEKLCFELTNFLFVIHCKIQSGSKHDLSLTISYCTTFFWNKVPCRNKWSVLEIRYKFLMSTT